MNAPPRLCHVSLINDRTVFKKPPRYKCRAIHHEYKTTVLATYRIMRLNTLVHAASSGKGRIDRVLFLSTVWPERTSSAAGVRTSDLVSSFLSRDIAVDFAATSAIDERCKPHVEALEGLGATPHVVQPNKESEFIRTLDRVRPDLVVFDRFYVEEMFSWMVAKHMPDVMRVVDMQDVHSLRGWRELLLKEQLKERNDVQGDMSRQIDLSSIVSSIPPASYEPCLRELSSIYRSDLTLVCSPIELDLLANSFHVPSCLLQEAGFFSDGRRDNTFMDFTSRQNVMMIGNFLHPPNKDSVLWACTELWPAIREQIGGDVRLDIYGAYGNEQALVSKIGNPDKLGVRLCGWLPSLSSMAAYRLLFAPLRFGAGLKGKVVDAWEHGLPVITTVIGSEGMEGMEGPRTGGSRSAETWGGAGTATTARQLIDDTVRLYTDKDAWNAAQSRADDILSHLYDRRTNLADIHARIEAIHAKLPAVRKTNYTGALLANSQHRATEYFSRWIEIKNKTQV